MTGSSYVRVVMAGVTILVICGGQLVSSRPPSNGLYDNSAPPPPDAEFMRRFADSLGAKKFLTNMDVPPYSSSSLAEGRLLVPGSSRNEELALNTEVRKLLAGTRNKRHCWDVTDVCCMWSIC